MKVQLVNIDSKIPNLALMQVSSYHKTIGDTVGFDVSNPDKVYISCVFEKNADQARGVKLFYPDSEIILGGSGIDLSLKLPQEIQKIKPDYDLYPSTYSLGFTTRGCIRNCPFCVVPKKEGGLHRWQHVSDFHDDRFDTVVLLDNNVAADKDWFFDNTDWILKKNLKWNPIQGMDIRILTPEIAERVKELKLNGVLHFAFDNLKDEDAVLRGIETLKNAGINIRRNVAFYVLTGFNTTIEEDIYRCNLLKQNNTNAFVMQYIPNQMTKQLARWANRKWLYWACEFEEYRKRN